MSRRLTRPFLSRNNKIRGKYHHNEKQGINKNFIQAVKKLNFSYTTALFNQINENLNHMTLKEKPEEKYLINQ